MTDKFRQELTNLAHQYFDRALSHIEYSTDFNEDLQKAILSQKLNEEAELPGYENRNLKFGQFENREFVVMMTDIRKSTEIINRPNGVVHMFLIFYVYAGIVAKIVDSHKGTSTEFLGDGVLNLFDTKDEGRDIALQSSMLASWDIMDALNSILNPLYSSYGIPTIQMGIGIDHGPTIVTKFGYRGDTDLKAFGRCAYNASKLSKGNNEIIVSENSKSVWPTGEGGNLYFNEQFYIDGKSAYKASKIQ